MLKKPLILASLLLTTLFALAQPIRHPQVKILLIPLDDRPPCLQFTQRIGLIGHADVVTPPKELLGRFTTPGQCDKIIEWLQRQDLASFDAAIVSLDMLVYGGLVASRVNAVDSATALRRVDVLQQLHQKAPRLRTYVQSVIMRLAPTSDSTNGAFRAQLAKWAEVSVQQTDSSRLITTAMEAKIPASALEDYKRARKRNLAVNSKAINLVRTGAIDYLILSQDDAKPVGVHVADRLQLVAQTERLNLTGKIAVQPGADEVSMLLLARALDQHYSFSPRIKAVYSSAAAADKIMPFEDKPLRQTVSYHIRATGTREAQDEKSADLLFYVFASRYEPGRAASFAAEIEDKIRQGRRVLIADIDPVGNVQGGDSAFITELSRRRLLPELNSYASWNTAANTIGTTLPQGLVFAIAEAKLLGDPAMRDSIWTAQNWFTFHRVLDDYYFHGMERMHINKHFGQAGLSSTVLNDAANKQVEAYATGLLQQSFTKLSTVYANRITGSRQLQVQCAQPSNMRFTLPWNRTFEADINFDITCHGK